MPDDGKKQKEKKEPKEQRRRRGRQNPAPTEKKAEKVPEAPKAVAAPEKPAYEPPPPEFYKNLKRETDEILKITEEANTKYKKKEIQSNWAKYEMPVESYEEIDEQENLGADYEALIQAPLSVGGHFQFKHEKSWDISTGPSPYDKYFDIKMDNLVTALSTITFYERNKIDTKFFNDSDIQSMNHRATKFKQKYYSDKKFTTPDLEVQDKITNTILGDNSDTIEINKGDEKQVKNTDDEVQSPFKNINLEDCEEQIPTEVENTDVESVVPIEKTASKVIPNPIINSYNQNVSKVINKTESLESLEDDSATEILNKTQKLDKFIDNDIDEIKQNEVDYQKEVEVKQNESKDQEKHEVQLKPTETVPKESHKAPSPQKAITTNPIIESPEDLEKWLDDFLDG